MSKYKASKITPLSVNKLFVLNCTEFFSKQCTPVITDSVLPQLNKWKNRTDTHRKRWNYFIDLQVKS